MTMDDNEFDVVPPKRTQEKKRRVPRAQSDNSASALPFEYEFDSEPELILVTRRHKSPHGRRNNCWKSESSTFSMAALPSINSVPTVNYVTCDRSVISFDIALALAEESSKSGPRSKEQQPISSKHAPLRKLSRRSFLRRQDSNCSVTSSKSSMSLKSIQSCFTTFLTPRRDPIGKPTNGVVEDSSSQTDKTSSSEIDAICDPETIKRRCSLGHGSVSPAQRKSRISATRALSPKVQSRERKETDSQSGTNAARALSPKMRSRERKEADSQSLLSISERRRPSLRARLSLPKLHFSGHNLTTP
jgi:hypothetical protein